MHLNNMANFWSIAPFLMGEYDIMPWNWICLATTKQTNEFVEKWSYPYKPWKRDRRALKYKVVQTIHSQMRFAISNCLPKTNSDPHRKQRYSQEFAGWSLSNLPLREF